MKRGGLERLCGELVCSSSCKSGAAELAEASSGDGQRATRLDAT